MKARLVVTAALLLLGVAFFWGRCGDRGSAAQAGRSVPVTRGSVRQTVSTDGRVASHQDLDIRCKAGGEVIRVPFDVGDTVRKGDLLLELEPSAEERSVRQAEAQRTAAEARLVQAGGRAEVTGRSAASRKAAAEAGLHASRAKAADARGRAGKLARLLGKELVSQAEADLADATAVQAEAEVVAAETRLLETQSREEAQELQRQEVLLAEAQAETARLDLAGARQRLSDVRIVSPIDGTVTRRNVGVGQLISPAAGGGTPVLTVSDLSRLYVLASVDESDIGRVNAGAAVSIALDAFPGERFCGHVVRIASRGTAVSNVVTFEVKVEVEGENRRLLRPEMTASVQLVVEEKNGALVVPARAVRRKGGQATALVLTRNGSVEERRVELGLTDGVVLEIRSGLSEGEKVLVEGDAPEGRPSKKKKFWNLSG